MRRIIYQSIASPAMDRAELFRLVYHARVANEQRGLSGFLLFADQRFLQVLEGDTWKLFATFDKIRADMRHTQVTMIDERSIAGPLFPNWRMRCFDEGGLTEALAAIDGEIDGPLPKVIEKAVCAFFGCNHADCDNRVGQRTQRGVINLSPRPAARPSFPRPC